MTLFSELNDAANYDVTLDGTTKSFKASDGKVASIALDQATIPYATETEVKLVSKDVNGVVLKELTTTDAASDANYNFTIDTKGNGYTNGSKLYLNKVNDTAEANTGYLNHSHKDFKDKSRPLIVLEHPFPCVLHHFGGCAQGFVDPHELVRDLISLELFRVGCGHRNRIVSVGFCVSIPLQFREYIQETR